MATSCSFEDVNGAILWSRLEALLSPQQNSHGCRRILFDVVQRLKSKRYETVLNTFTLLHTYSVNASTDALKPLASDHIYNVFAELQKGKSNTLAAGLAQLLHDWKHMFKDEGLGAKFDQLYQDVLPRAAPQIRPSAPAERYLRDPPTGAETFRKPLHKGFDFALFNQKARRIAYASGAAHPTGASSTGGSSIMPQQHAAPAVPSSSFYRATTLPTPTSDKVNVPSKQPSADVQNTPIHAVHDQASPTSSGAQSPSPLAADLSNPPAPASPSDLPAPRPAEPPKPQPQSQIPSLVSRPKVPTSTPAFPPAHRTGDRHTLDNYTKDSVLSYLDSAPLDTTMPEPPAAQELPPEPAPSRRRDTSASTSSSRLRTQDPPSDSDAGVAGSSISRLQDRLAEDFGSPKHALDKAATPTLATLPSTDMRSATMPPLVHGEGSGVTEDSNCVVSEIISSQPGGRRYMPSTVDEEAAEAGSAPEDEAAEVAPAHSDMLSSEIAGEDAGDATSPAAASDSGEMRPAASSPEPPSEPCPAQVIDAEPQVPAKPSTAAPSSAPVGQPPNREADVTPASATVPARAAAAGAAGGAAGAQLPKAEGPHTMALKMLAGGPPGAATMSFKDCAPRNIVKQASDLMSTSDVAAQQDTMAMVREAQRQVTQLQPTLEEEEENSMSQVMAETPGTREIPDAAYSSKVDSPLTEGLSREALRAKELIDALVTHCELVGRFRRLVQAARDDGSERQERMFLELGTTQAQTCRQQRQQLHRALALLGEEQALMSQLLKANDMCSLELRLWEQLAGSAPHGADSRPSQPLQELCLRPNLDSNGSGSPDAAMMAKAAQHSVDSGKVAVLANVARQPALRLCDPSYVAALANATQRHAH